jgi:UDP-glucose 4-epimerase
MHFAASAFVAESVEKPALYFENNVQQGISLLNALVDAGVRRFIFSSSCTVYGEVTRIPIGEDSPLWPKNPYGAGIHDWIRPQIVVLVLIPADCPAQTPILPQAYSLLLCF